MSNISGEYNDTLTQSILEGDCIYNSNHLSHNYKNNFLMLVCSEYEPGLQKMFLTEL